MKILYLKTLLSGYNSNNTNWLQELAIWFAILESVSICIIGTCSNAVK